MLDVRLIAKLYALIFAIILLLLWAIIQKLPEMHENPVERRIFYRDWHDYNAMEVDAQRVGLGEAGVPAYIVNKSIEEEMKEMSLLHGFNALLSDKISVNRSLPDIRHKGCRLKKYLATLPAVSIVIPFNNEHLSVLLRTVHSLVNRTPPELLREIILVDDASVYGNLYGELERYVSKHFSNVRILRLPQRSGLIGARLAGARQARAPVLVFMDSHIEANYNWLPPLLEPIALNDRTAVCPFIDVIDDKNFEYGPQDEGARGAFNWIFDYKRLPLLNENLVDRTKPFKNPVMAGGLFAISSEFFWELGGYDEGLDIWGGEQYELSFKIWMCGGQLLDAPCSRVGHIYRGEHLSQPVPQAGDYLHRNYKRVAEVWMDEFKQYLYEHDDAYATIDAGNLTLQKELRSKLKCRDFKWYMENVAFDLTKIFPPVEPADYANGAIQSLADPTLCLDALNSEAHSMVGLATCDKKKQQSEQSQHWALTGHRDIRKRPEFLCLRVEAPEANAAVLLWECQEEGGDQFWYYDPIKKWIIFERNGDRCLEAVPSKRSVRVNKCREKNTRMKWKFDFVNMTALANFFIDIPDVEYLF